MEEGGRKKKRGGQSEEEQSERVREGEREGGRRREGMPCDSEIKYRM